MDRVKPELKQSGLLSAIKGSASGQEVPVKKIVGASVLALLLASGMAGAQNTIENNGVPGSGNAIGQKEAYPPNDPARTRRGTSSQSIPGAVGAGSSTIEQEAQHGGDPSRNGPAGVPTDPKRAGQVGDTGTGQ